MDRVVECGFSEVFAQELSHAEVDRAVEEVFEGVVDCEEIEEG